MAKKDEELEDDALPGDENEEQGNEQQAADEGHEQHAEEQQEESRLAEGGEADGDDGEEKEGESAEDKPARPKKTSKQRRDERRASERRVREERDFLLQQMAEMRQQLANVESTAIDSRVMTVDARLSECLNDAEQAERLELAALEAKDSEGVIQARRIREKAAAQANLFKTEKERLAQVLAQRKANPAAPAPVPGATEIAQHAAQYRADKPWIQFDPRTGAPLNAESAVALSVDHALRKEGKYSERETGYWRELDKRVKAALPHMFQPENTDQEGDVDDDDEDELEVVETPQKPAKQQVAAKPAVAGKKGPAVGSSGRQQNAAQNAQRLSPDRVAALKELGVWDSPKERKEWIDYYAKWDRDHTAN